MTGLFHAISGALIGSFLPSRSAAFGAGVVSHAIGDMIPHKEAPLVFDASTTPVALLAIGWKFGFDSSKFAGALGGVCPDFEHVSVILGLREEDAGFFPTHNGALPHGKADSFSHQVLLGALCLSALCLRR